MTPLGHEATALITAWGNASGARRPLMVKKLRRPEPTRSARLEIQLGAGGDRLERLVLRGSRAIAGFAIMILKHETNV